MTHQGADELTPRDLPELGPQAVTRTLWRHGQVLDITNTAVTWLRVEMLVHRVALLVLVCWAVTR